MSRFAAEDISSKEISEILARYENHIPSGLEELDDLRFKELPQAVAKRKQEQTTKTKEKRKKAELGPLLTKDEVIELVNWKLKHGTFRPRLLQLVKSNEESDVNRVIQSLGTEDTRSKEKIKVLTELKGIGPATASLVLSCIDPQHYPFFSDELFRWTHWDGKNADGTTGGIKTGKGWKRPIGYTHKEYDSLLARCQALRERLHDDDEDLSFLDLEKVAYVLGKEDINIDSQTTSDRVATKKRGPEEDRDGTLLKTDQKRIRKRK